MRGLLQNLRWFAPYAASIALTRGMALISIPLVTRYLSPDEYGRLELILSVVEFAGIVLSFAVADVLFRLAAEGDEESARGQVRALGGLTLVLAISVGLFLQALVFAGSGLVQGVVDAQLLAIGLLGASISGLIEMPLAWIRCRGRANVFLFYVAARAILQILVMWALLSHGWGALGLLAGNACVDVLIASTLVFRQWRDVGFSIDREVFARAARYGGPLVLGSLAMFVLGACDRWFLAGAAPIADIAFYALAAKLAMAVALAVQPFGLWWYPQRIRMLCEPDGLRRSARAVTAGFALLMAGAIGVAGLAPFLFELLLPVAYAPALGLLTPLIAIIVLNEACSLLNVGAYAGRTGFLPLAVNSAGAVVALTGYVTLVPSHGVGGAVAATVAAHAVRLAAYLVAGRSRAPIPYQYPAILLMSLVAGLAAPAAVAAGPFERMVIMTAGVAAIAVIAALSCANRGGKQAPATFSNAEGAL